MGRSACTEVGCIPFKHHLFVHISTLQAAIHAQGLSCSVCVLRFALWNMPVPEFLSACRLSHAAPSPANAAWIASRCPNLRVLIATGCTQLTAESLLALAHIPFEVSPCRQCLSGHRDTSLRQVQRVLQLANSTCIFLLYHTLLTAM
jgi:hypothetical protein